MWSTVGFLAQKEYFGHLLGKGTLAHAYLFSGPEMIGKRKFAQEVYHRANNSDASSIDLKVVAPRVNEGESKIYIEDIRGVASFLSHKPLYGPYQFVIIDDAHQLTLEASNALLKILEEPHPGAVLILVTSQPQQLLPTVRSRSQEVPFLPHASEVIQSVLTSKQADTEVAKLLTETASGRIGWVIRTLELDAVKEIETAIGDLQKLAKQNMAERMQYAKKLVEKENYETVVGYWLRWLHARLGQSERIPMIVRDLLHTQYLLSQPQYNHRLALESFLLKL